MKEENVWKDFPSEHDKYAGWAKRMGELQVEAYNKEFNFEGLFFEDQQIFMVQI